MACMASFIMVSMCGCWSTSGTTGVSMNYQRCAARTTGDITSTIVLEIERGKVTAAQVIDFANKVKQVVATQDVAMTVEQLKLKLSVLTQVPALQNTLDKMLALIPNGAKLDQIKKLINCYCDGLILGANQFDPNDKDIVQVTK